jgi:two-component system sensor histidine kinase/response regulator
MSDKPKILVIDDEPTLRVGLAAVIKRRGYTVDTAGDGKEGIQKAREFMPDLILSDVMMPPPNGFEMRRIMGKDTGLASIPFIFLTARTDVNDRVTGIRDGADDYITKPCVPDELIARIESVLRRVALERTRGREQMSEIATSEMEKHKREILQNFHHELRTPLTNIMMPLELIVKNKFHDPMEQTDFIRVALANVDRLESLVTDIVILSNIDHGDLNHIRQFIDMDIHILPAVNKRLERYKSKNLDFTYDIVLQNQITAPRTEFIHSIAHLVDNALKFSPEYGKVKLTIESGLRGGVIITVQDEGPGIPIELRDRAFERFYQISRGDTRTHEGLGVGLTIARAVFTSMNGFVLIMDSPVGCCVRAVLPD